MGIDILMENNNTVMNLNMHLKRLFMKSLEMKQAKSGNEAKLVPIVAPDYQVIF